VKQARADAGRLGIANVRFEQGSTAEGRFDVVIAVFFLHHLPDSELAALPRRLHDLLAPGGVFYSLDPSSRRLSGAVGRVLIPWMMKRYQTPDERELEPESTLALFRSAGFDARTEMYDFISSPLAGLLPSWRAGYRAARAIDRFILRFSALHRVGSNFELIACRT
jgi:SAM-dependent methyltransferase